MFNKSFWSMKQDLAHGHGVGFSLFGGQGVAKGDAQAILNYNTALKNGVPPARAWATTMSKASIAAQEQTRQCIKSKGSLIDLANGLQTTSVKAKAAAIGLKALSIAGNMLLFAGISMGISALFKGIDYLIHRTEKMQEALQNSVDEFNTVTDELKTLEEELKTTTERLEELQKLADNSTISVAEEAELETLKKTNKELARKIALKQQEQAQEARDVLKDSKKNANSTVTSKYKGHSNSSGERFDYENITPDEELGLAIKAYETNSKALENNRGTNLEGWYEDQTEAAKNRIEEMYALISPTIDAYEDLINAGIELEGEDKTRYEQLKKSQDAYLAYIYTLNGTREAFEGLNAEQQRNVLLNRLIKQGLSEDVAKAIVGAISDEDLDKYWDKNFSFVPPEMKDGETAEEYGKRYAEAWAKGLEEGAKDVNKMTVSLSETADKIKELHSFIKELDDDGLSPDSIEKIISDYPELIGYIGDEARLRTELKKKIAEEETKYKQALRNKIMASSSFTELVISKNETLFKELGLAYDKDTQKFELENQKKLAIAQRYGDAAKQSWEWSKNTWGQIWADEQVLSAPDFTTELHAAGKNSKYKTQSGDWKFEVFNNGEQKTYTYEAGSAMAKILDSQRELANITNFDIDFGDDSSSSKDSYEDLYDEFLETLEQEVENIDDSISRINTKLEHAIKTGNAEQINILSKELDDAYAQKKELLESKANEARTQLALIMEEIYDIAPHLRGKSINEITPYEIEAISMSLGDASNKWDSITKSAQNYYETISEWSDKWWKNEEDKLNSTEEYYNTILDEIDRYVERIEEHYDDQIKYEEALLEIKQAQFEAQNNIADAQAEIDKEIRNSRNSKQYLSKSEYEKIFNEEDYKELSGIISDIDDDISDLTDNFYKQVEDAYANGQVYLVEHITAEYERQLAMKERELEIAKANVDLEKKRLTLENTLAEKNIKQYSENGITWVADQEKVKQATEDFADAQAEIANLQKKATQQREIDSRQANIDMLEMQKDALNDSIEKLKEAIEDVTDPLADFGTLIQTLITDINKSISDTAKSVNSNVNKVSGNASSSNGSRGNIGSSGGSGGSGGSSGGSGGTGRVSKTDNYDGTHNYTDSSNIISINGQLYDRSQTDSNGLAKPIKNATEVLYDSGGVASGKGLMLKGVDEEETVLPPWLTKQVLTPEYNENFSKLLENMQMVSLFNPSDFVVQPQIANLPTRDISQPTSISKTWTGNMYVEGGDPNEVLKAISDAFDRNMP